MRRYDLGTLGNVERTPQGGLRVPAFPTRAGVLVYRNSDGSERLELRHPDEVFAPESLASLRGATVTDLHPTNPIDPNNWKDHAIGHVGEDVRQDGHHVASSLVIQHADAIDKIGRNERRELSCGYDCDLDPTPGVWEGQRYDARQTNIKYNHVAILPKGAGRGGATVAMRLDAGDAVQVHSDKSVCDREGDQMAMVRVDGIDYEAGSQSHLQAVDRLLAKNAEALKEATGRADKAEGDLKAANVKAGEEKARADKAEGDLKKAKDPKALTEAVRRRADMLGLARRVAGITGTRWDDAAEEEAAGDSEDGVMGRILAMIDPDFKAEGLSPEEVRGYAMGRIAALLKAAPAEMSEDDKQAPPAGNEREGEVSGGVYPPAAPGRSDGKGGGLLSRLGFGSGGIFGARRSASHEDGRGLQGGGGRSDSKGKDTPAAAERRMREDHAGAWNTPLAYTKDPATK